MLYERAKQLLVEPFQNQIGFWNSKCLNVVRETIYLFFYLAYIRDIVVSFPSLYRT